MPRSGRIILPNYPHHLIQRGHNRSDVFTEDADYLFYLENLAELKVELGFRLFGYCLMTNHVHLVVDPGDDPTSIASLMKRLAGRYTTYVNKIEKRTGTVWEGRFKSSQIDSDDYLLECCRYADLNPKRVGMVRLRQDYRWSSYNEKIGRRVRCLIDEDLCYRGLGRTRREREVACRDWVLAGIPDETWTVIRAAVQRGQVTGNQRSIDEVERRIGRRIESRPQGRSWACNE